MFQLLFLPWSRRWLLKLGKNHWKIESRTDAMTLAGLLPLEIVDSNAYGKEHSPRGMVSVVSESSAGCNLQFLDLAGRPERSNVHLAPIPVVGGSIEWLEGYYADGWLSCDANLSIEAVRTIGIRAFLPVAGAQTRKSVSVLYDGKPLGQFDVARGQVAEVRFDLSEVDRRRHQLDLRSAYPEATLPEGDQRLLGFVVVGLNVDETGWEAPERFA